MSDLKIASDLYIVIINNTKTVAQHLEENKWRICGSMVNYQNTDVDVIKHLDLANEPTTSNENALNIDLVSNKGDYVEYKGGSTSKLLIKGNKYRLTCSPFRDRIAIINEGGSRMNTLKKYFDC